MHRLLKQHKNGAVLLIIYCLEYIKRQSDSICTVDGATDVDILRRYVRVFDGRKKNRSVATSFYLTSN